MKKVFIINGGKDYHHSKGKLSDYLTNIAKDFLQESACDVNITNIDKGYDLKEEVEKYLWADIVIYQVPAWWMGVPWIVKRYIDEVFMEGVGKLFESDGRVPESPTQGYGKGGLLQDKKYMISATWNAPKEAFEEEHQFFEGKGIDTVYFAFHKANQFIGMKPLETFICNDVMKNPQIENDIIRYKKHLKEIVLS